MKKILITGIAGFIGHHLAKLLLKHDYDVVGIDNLNDYYDPQLKLLRLKDLGIDTGNILYNEILKADNLSFIKLDLTDKKNIYKLFEQNNFDFVIHLAAQAGVRYSLVNPQAYIDSNITGFLNILESIRNHPVKHFIFASSSSVYGLNEQVPFATHHHTDHPVSIYAATKKSNEMMAHTYAHLFDIPTTGLRFFTVYGPYGRPDMALNIFTKNILEGKEIKVFNNGDMSRDFTYVGDIVESIRRLIPLSPKKNSKGFDPQNPNPAVSSASYRLFNIGNNSPVKLMDFIRAIEKALNKKAKINFQPMQAGDVKQTYADVTELFEYIHFKPQTDLENGIGEFVGNYREVYLLKK